MPPKKRATKSNGERIKRPVLPRTEPIRAWSTLFGQAPPSATNASSRARPAPGGDGVDAVQRGVELGYRVMDEYIRQGATIAGAFASPAPGRLPSADDLPRMTERMMKYASDFSSLWFDAMNVMLGANGRAQNGSSAASSDDFRVRHERAPAPTVEGRSRYVLEVKSQRPAEIIVALDAPATSELSVEPLRARPRGKAITDVAIRVPEPGGPLRIRVHVPAALAPGRYTGAVLESATKQPRGRLTVVLRGE
jgi:hypothetical protein